MNKTKQAIMMTGAVFAGTLLSANHSSQVKADTLKVKDGDTLSEIALNHGTTVEKLMRANDLTDDKIYSGSTLNVENATRTDSRFKAGDDGKYTVESGDTLSQIAEANNISLDKLMQLNGLRSDLIFVDQILTVSDSLQDSALTASGENNYQNYSLLPETADQAVQQNYSEPTNANSGQNVTTIDQSEESAKSWIANKESGGSYTAQNGQYYGKYQLTNSYLNGDYSPGNQERVADNYVKNRYGSWANAQAFWQANGWY